MSLKIDLIKSVLPAKGFLTGLDSIKPHRDRLRLYSSIKELG